MLDAHPACPFALSLLGDILSAQHREAVRMGQAGVAEQVADWGRRVYSLLVVADPLRRGYWTLRAGLLG